MVGRARGTPQTRSSNAPFSRTESAWADFIVEGPASMEAPSNGDYAAWEDGFRLTDDETLAGALARYDEVAARTDSLVEAVDLDHSWPLPPQPWFEPGSTRSARRVFLHIIAETAQHVGLPAEGLAARARLAHADDGGAVVGEIVRVALVAASGEVPEPAKARRHGGLRRELREPCHTEERTRTARDRLPFPVVRA